jgi:RNA polymerase sigma-70 factor, ECF subfamily
MAMPRHVTADTVPLTVPTSFEEAYREYAPRVVRWAQQLGGRDIDPEDVLQEVFLIVNRKLAGFRGEGSFTSWMFEITRKVVSNHRRGFLRRFWRPSSQEDLESIPSPGLDPAAELERRRMIALLYRALDRLPEKYRTVFALYELDGMSTPAIAELLKTNLSTIKVQLGRARHRFVQAYQKLLHKEASGEATCLSEIAARVTRPVKPAPPGSRRGTP